MSETPLLIRAAGPRDLGAVLALWRVLQETSAGFEPRLRPNPQAEEWFSAFLRDQLDEPGASVLLACEGDEIVGYIFGQLLRRPTLEAGDCGYIADLCVREDCRGRGVGRRLFGSLRAWFIGRGVRALEVQVVRANPASQAFWRKMGFSDFLRTLRMEI